MLIWVYPLKNKEDSVKIITPFDEKKLSWRCAGSLDANVYYSSNKVSSNLRCKRNYFTISPTEHATWDTTSIWRYRS